MKIGVLAADGFQDSQYFLPKIEIEKLGLETEVISLSHAPIEIYSFFSRIGLLDVQKTIDEANPADYVGVLVPGGAKSPAILSENENVLSFLRTLNGERKLIAPICRGTLLVATSACPSQLLIRKLSSGRRCTRS
jgi:deglycase